MPEPGVEGACARTNDRTATATRAQTDDLSMGDYRSDRRSAVGARRSEVGSPIGSAVGGRRSAFGSRQSDRIGGRRSALGVRKSAVRSDRRSAAALGVRKSAVRSDRRSAVGARRSEVGSPIGSAVGGRRSALHRPRTRRAPSAERRIWHQTCPTPTGPGGVATREPTHDATVSCSKHDWFHLTSEARGDYHGAGEHYRTVGPCVVPVSRSGHGQVCLRWSSSRAWRR